MQSNPIIALISQLTTTLWLGASRCECIHTADTVELIDDGRGCSPEEIFNKLCLKLIDAKVMIISKTATGVVQSHPPQHQRLSFFSRSGTHVVIQACVGLSELKEQLQW